MDKNINLYVIITGHDKSFIDDMEDKLSKSHGKIDIKKVINKEDLAENLNAFVPDAIIFDYESTDFNINEASSLLKIKKSNIPVIVISETYDEERAISLIRAGVDDYILKSNLERLPLSIYIAIEKKKRAVKKLKEVYDILETTPAVVFLWKNKEGCPVEFVTENVIGLFGYSAEEFMSEKVMYNKTIHPDDLKRVADEVARYSTRKGRKTFTHKPYRIVTKDGEVKWIEDNTFIRRDAHNRITHYQGVVIDITNLKNMEEELRKLTIHLESTREEERTIISREIHDELGQTLTALKMDIAWMKKRIPDSNIDILRKTETMGQLLNSSIRAVQRISAQLRPSILDDLGLAAAVEWQAYEFKKYSQIKTKLDINPPDFFIDPQKSIALFRVLQESLTNVSRHSEASLVKITLEKTENNVRLEVQDNGCGIAPEEESNPGSYGIRGMKERIRAVDGEIRIKGSPGKGTIVKINVPL